MEHTAASTANNERKQMKARISYEITQDEKKAVEEVMAKTKWSRAKVGKEALLAYLKQRRVG